MSNHGIYKAYALLDHGGIQRVTFSESLAAALKEQRKLDISPVEISAGRELKPGEISPTGAYALVARRKNKLLRCCLDHEIAQLLRQPDIHYLAEAAVKCLTDTDGASG